jgi:hypothetical protein
MPKGTDTRRLYTARPGAVYPTTSPRSSGADD